MTEHPHPPPDGAPETEEAPVDAPATEAVLEAVTEELRAEEWVPEALEPEPAAPEPAAAPEPEPASEPAPEPDGPDPFEQLGERQVAILAALARIEEATGLVAREREMTDRLHAEIQVLRRGELAEAQAPLVRDVIRLTDFIDRLREVSPAADDLDLIRGQVVEILARAGVEAYAPEPGEPFDASAHNGVRRVPTADASLARTVATVLKPGFRNAHGRVIRPADVEVNHVEPQGGTD